MIAEKLYDIFPLVSKRTLVRRASEADIDWYIANMYEDYFNEFIDSKISNLSDTLVRSHVEANIRDMRDYKAVNCMRYIITNKETHERIGGITLTVVEPKQCLLAYWVRPEYQGNGYCKEVVKLASEQISEKGVTVVLAIQSINEKSLRVAKSTGFRQYRSYNGKVCTNYLYEYIGA